MRPGTSLAAPLAPPAGSRWESRGLDERPCPLPASAVAGPPTPVNTSDTYTRCGHARPLDNFRRKAMLSNHGNRKLSIALVIALLAAAIVPGLASASPGQCERSVGEAVKYVTTQIDGAMGGPNDLWGWAHPDGKFGTPGQAMQY